MKLYLDDDVASPILAQLLRKAGHNVLLPTEAGWAGSRDADHLRHAIQEDRVCLTRNYDDFQSLHDLVRAVSGHHPGILVVRRDNNPKRNLKPRDVVRAIAKLIAARVLLADQYLTLNQWR